MPAPAAQRPGRSQSQGPLAGRPHVSTAGSSRTAPRSETAAGSDQPHDQQQDDRADRGIDDFRHKAAAEMNAEPWKQQAGDQRAGDADENIADDAKAGATDNLTGK